MANGKAFRFTPAAVLRFTGEDQFEFPQGQGTADLRGTGDVCRYTLWLDHKGLVQGDGFVLRESAGSTLLVSYASPAAFLMAKFDRHIIADDVEMENLTADFELVSCKVEDLRAFLPERGGGDVIAGTFGRLDDGYCYKGRRLGLETLDCLVPDGADVPFPGQWIDLAEAERCRIEEGLPLIPRDTSAHPLNPLEANLVSALSFDKGCYLGQEVVARVHRLERMSRRLVQFTGAGTSGELPDSLQLDDTVAGGITSVANFPDKLLAIGWMKSRYPDGQYAFGNLTLNVRSLPAS
jgi:folate-binding protein YgfZ